MRILDCNIRCWECSQDCTIKESFSLPDFLFYKSIVNWAKSSAGYIMLVENIPKQDMEKEVQFTCVSLKLAREQYLKNLKS